MYFLSFQYVKELYPVNQDCDEARIRTVGLPDLYRDALPLSYIN